MDNPEGVGSRNSYCRINDWTNLSDLRFSEKSRELETHAVPRKTTNASGLLSKN
jgi:hypothetical protein